MRATFGEQGKDERLRALKASAGSWEGWRTSGAEYVEALRSGDLNERLARLGADLLTTNVRHFPMLAGLESAY